MKKAIKNIFKYFCKTMIGLFIVFILFLGSLFFREQRIPRWIVNFIAEKCSTEYLEIDCRRVYIGFRHGLRFRELTIYDKDETSTSFNLPIVKSKDIQYDFLSKRIVIDRLEYKRLPDSYYLPIDTNIPQSPLEFDIPSIDNIDVELTSPHILGLILNKVTLKVRTDKVKKRVFCKDVKVELAGQDSDTTVIGDLTLDLERQKLYTKMQGDATQRQIRPLLEVLDIQCALPYMDAFTGIPTPVDAKCEIEIDLFNLDFSMLLNLDVTKMGRYNLVPLSYAKGGIFFHSRLADAKRVVALKVFITSSKDYADNSLVGWLTVDDFSGRYKINYHVDNELNLDDAFKIADFMDPSILDFIEFKSDSRVSVKGCSGTSSDDLDLNNLYGEFKSGSGVVDGFEYTDLSGQYSLKGDVVSVDAKMNGTSGGKVDFSTLIYCEKFEDNKAHYKLKGSYRDGSLKELADAFSFDLGDRKGKVDIDLDISGKISTNFWPTVNGKGKVKITDGHLARMKLFSKLTELLAELVPGVSFLVDQTQASADFTFENGVLNTENLYIEGGLVSIKGWGCYDIAKDNLDFIVRVQFAKKESVAGKIIQSITYPITKLLSEFKVTGPIDDPKWEYIQLTDRIF